MYRNEGIFFSILFRSWICVRLSEVQRDAKFILVRTWTQRKSKESGPCVRLEQTQIDTERPADAKLMSISSLALKNINLNGKEKYTNQFCYTEINAWPPISSQKTTKPKLSATKNTTTHIEQQNCRVSSIPTKKNFSFWLKRVNRNENEKKNNRE